MKKNNLGYGMLIVLVANIVSMIFNVAINFIQPKFLPVNSYAEIKTFSLYLSCIGFFHLGFEDGMYLKYGGKDLNEINKVELNRNMSTLRVFQLGIGILIFIVGIVSSNYTLAIFGALLLPYNMTMYFKLLYQATGNFDLYGKIMNASTIILFLGNIVLLFVMNIRKYIPYLILNVCVYLIIWILLEIDCRKKIQCKLLLSVFSVKELISSIKSGFLIMLGNFSSVFMTSMDRWFVKYLLPTVDFAEYSFAVSMESMLSVAVTPFTVTMYNYFCRQKNDDNVRRMHNLILIVASVLVACAFPAKLVIQIWLVDYMNSVSVLFYLFGAQIFFIIIKSIYVNLYKARQMQKVYFVKLVLVLGAGICMNIILYLIMKEKEAMAIGTMVSAVFWFLLCQNDFKNIRYDWKHIVYMMIAVVSFILLGNNLGAIQGCVLYLAIVCIGCIVLLREDVTYLSQIIKRTFYGKSKSGQRSC